MVVAFDASGETGRKFKVQLENNPSGWLDESHRSQGGGIYFSSLLHIRAPVFFKMATDATGGVL
jgi:hypothetical protein